MHGRRPSTRESDTGSFPGTCEAKRKAAPSPNLGSACSVTVNKMEENNNPARPLLPAPATRRYITPWFIHARYRQGSGSKYIYARAVPTHRVLCLRRGPPPAARTLAFSRSPAFVYFWARKRMARAPSISQPSSAMSPPYTSLCTSVPRIRVTFVRNAAASGILPPCSSLYTFCFANGRLLHSDAACVFVGCRGRRNQ